MIEIILNAIKIAFSEDVRTGASALIDLVKRSPDWQNDICVLEAHIDRHAFEHAYLLGGLTCDKLKNLGFSENSIDDFRTTYDELVSNAIEHGSVSGKKALLTIVIEITLHYVSATIKNSKGVKFDLDKALRTRMASIDQDSNVVRGRGLILVSLLADTLSATEDSEGVKVVFYRPSVDVRKYSLPQILVIEVRDGMENPSLGRRLGDLFRQHMETDIVVHFGTLPIEQRKSNYDGENAKSGQDTKETKPEDKKATDTSEEEASGRSPRTPPRRRARTVLILEMMAESQKRKSQVVLVFESTPERDVFGEMARILPESVIARSLSEAFQKLGWRGQYPLLWDRLYQPSERNQLLLESNQQ